MIDTESGSTNLETYLRRFCAESKAGVWSDIRTGQIHCEVDFENPIADPWKEGCHLCGSETPAGSRQGIVTWGDVDGIPRPLVYYAEDFARGGGRYIPHVTPCEYELICPRCVDWMDALEHYIRIGSKVPYGFYVGDVVSLADGSCRYEIVKRGHTGIITSGILWPYYMGRCLDRHTDYVRWLNECQVTKIMESPEHPTRLLSPLPRPDPLATIAALPARALPRLEDLMAPARTRTGLPRLEDIVTPATRFLPKGGGR